MNVAVYYRVSTKGQGEDDRYGLPAQRAAVERFCRTNRHSIVATFEDRASGATADRPELARLLSESGFEAVVVARWDRLARDRTLDGYLRYSLGRHGVGVLSATEENGADPHAELTQGILAAVAGFERHLIRQRLLAARQLKRQRGGYAEGKPRYGTKALNGSLVVDATEARVIDVARRLRRGRQTYREIAAALDAKGLKPRSGGRWSASTICDILKRRPKTARR